LVAAAAFVDERISGVLVRHGLNFERWISDLSAEAWADTQPADSISVVFTPNVNKALGWYAENFRTRPVDAIGLAVALLENISKSARTSLEKSGLSIAAAAGELSALIYRMAGPRFDNLSQFGALRQYRLSESAERLRDEARQIAGQYNAPMTTSVMVLATDTMPSRTARQRWTISKDFSDSVLDPPTNGRSDAESAFWIDRGSP
jgi:hypothetical protein